MSTSYAILHLPDGEGTLQRAIEQLSAEGGCEILDSARLTSSTPDSPSDTFSVSIGAKSLDELRDNLPGLHIEELTTYHAT